MKPLNQKAQKVYDQIMSLLGQRHYLKIDHSDGVFMPLSVDRIDENRVSLAHNGIQNGDLMADPDMEFIILGGRAYPVTFQNDYMGIYQQAEDDAGTQADMVAFANTWMLNLAEEQGL